jgi:hypothetical protein
VGHLLQAPKVDLLKCELHSVLQACVPGSSTTWFLFGFCS